MAKEVKNYLKSVKEITAPLNWKSSPDSPPTQLAYKTQPEIDMLVKANIHGSMNGKPNKGPKGIISLDGFGVDDEDSVVSQSTQQQYQQNLQQSKPSQQVGTSQSSFDQPGAVIPTVFQQQYQMEQDQDKPIPGVSFGDQMGVTLTPEEAKKVREEKTEEKTDEEKEALKAKTPEDLLKVLQDKALGQKALSQKQLIRIVNLLAANQQNPNVLNDEEQSAFSGLFDENRLEQFVENYRVNYPDYFEGTIPGTGAVVTALADSVTAGDFRDDKMNVLGLGDEVGSFTLQGLDKALTSSEKEYLKKFRPDLYYGTSSVPGFGAQTSGGLADLASLDASKYADKNSASYNPDFANQIFAARADLDRMGKDMFGNTQGGGQGGGGGTYIPPVTPPVDPTDPTDPIPPQQPTLPPGITPLNPSTRFPDSVIRDYTQLGLPQIYGNQQMPNYANFYQGQGGQPVGLQNYLDNLRRRFGIG